MNEQLPPEPKKKTADLKTYKHQKWLEYKEEFVRKTISFTKSEFKELELIAGKGKVTAFLKNLIVTSLLSPSEQKDNKTFILVEIENNNQSINKRTTVAFTKSEHQAVTSLAEQYKMSLSTLLRKLVIAQVQQQIMSPPPAANPEAQKIHQQLDEATKQLKKLGNNINQACYKINDHLLRGGMITVKEAENIFNNFAIHLQKVDKRLQQLSLQEVTYDNKVPE